MNMIIELFEESIGSSAEWTGIWIFFSIDTMFFIQMSMKVVLSCKNIFTN